MKEPILQEQKKQQPVNVQSFQYKQPFPLESGVTLDELTIAYHTWGTLNDSKDNVIWICHALTANANAQEWWPNMIGEGLPFDTKKYFIICANILGSCYGSTGPSNINPSTGQPYYQSFPLVTIRDMVNAHELLRQHLGINQIYLLAGGSMGGYQALEWCVMQPELIKHQFLLVTSAKETAWGIAIHTAQRMAIETDCTWGEANEKAGSNGLKVARGIGMLTYRSYESFVKTQTDTDNNKLENFRASSYIKYQGDKLANRFTAHSYHALTKSLDSHNLARGRGEMRDVLKTIRAKTLVLGITSDVLCPIQEQQFIAEHIPGATFAAIDSLYGHDGFLVEMNTITRILMKWLQ